MRSTAALLLCAAAAWGQNWPAFRGPMASGILEGADPPVKWNAETGSNVVWKTPLPGISVSSPVVWEDRVFAVTAISSDPKSEFRHGLYGDTEPARDMSVHTYNVYCLDRKTGKILWERTAYKGAPRTKRHPKNSFAAPTPATDGQRVIAYFGGEGIFAYDMQGKPLWHKDLGVIDAGWFFDPDYQWGVASSPIIWRDLVVLQADQQKGSYLAAFDAATGRQLWRVKRDEIPSWGTPVVLERDGKAMLVTNATKAIRGYDPGTGKELWTLGDNSEITATTPVEGDGLIFVANGYPPVQPIYAIKWTAKGDITLKGDAPSNAHIAWSAKRGGPYLPSPLFYRGILYILSNNGVFSGYDGPTGQRLFQERVAGKGGAFSASPVASGGRIYLASEDGDVHVARAGTKPEWLSSNPMGEVLMGTPALAKGMIVVRGMKHIYGIAAGGRISASNR
jgi:outer membrane protein assembly factor BamB